MDGGDDGEIGRVERGRQYGCMGGGWKQEERFELG